MKPSFKILVPYDFSDRSDCALDLAIQIARSKDHVKIKLLHVLEYNAYPYDQITLFPSVNYSADLYFSDVCKEVDIKIQNRLRRLNVCDLDIDTVVKTREIDQDVADIILEETGCDLICMGISQSNGLFQKFIFNTIQKVVNKSKIPVFSLNHLFILRNYSKACLAIDPDTIDKINFSRINVLKEWFNLELHVVSIVKPCDVVYSSKNMTSFEEKLQLAGLQYDRASFYGSKSVKDGILEFALQQEADLILMPTKSKTGIEHVFIGSTTAYTTAESYIPILSFTHT